MPWITPRTETSTTNLNGSVYGAGGMATVNGTATTTIYGSQTSYIPYSVNRSDYLAVYLVKYMTWLGAVYNNLNDEERQKIGSNSGVVVVVVVRAMVNSGV